MRLLLRSLILLLLILWVGAVMYFPVLAWASFTSLPTAHQAGMIVLKALTTLHFEGLVAGALLVTFLILAQRLRAFPRSVIAPIVLILIMMGLTAFSQFSIIPRMNHDRIHAGGIIDAVPAANPYREDFDRLHKQSVAFEEGVLAGGILAAIGIAWAIGSGAATKQQA